MTAPRPLPRRAAPAPRRSVPAPEPVESRPAEPGPAAEPDRGVPPAAASPATARPAGAGSPDADLVRERWPEILEAIKRGSRVAWMQLSSAAVDTLQDGILTLRFAREGEAKGFSARRSDEDLGRVLEQMLGIKPQIRAIAGPGARGSAAEPGGSARPSGPGGHGGSTDSPERGGSDGSAGSSDGGSGDASAGNARAAGPAARGPRRAQAGGGSPDRTGSGGISATGPAYADEADDAPGASALTGMDLIQRTLGGQVIEEIGGD